MSKSSLRPPQLFWSLSVREAQFLLRAFPPRARRSKDDSVRIKVLSCPCCGVVGFGGLGGDTPRLAVFKDGVDFWLGEGCHINRSVFEKRLGHIGSCPMAGKPVDLLECCVTFGEAKYLYKSIDAVETNSTFKSRSGRLTAGTQLALSTEAGLAVSPVCGVLTEQANENEKDDTVCVLVEDKETG